MNWKVRRKVRRSCATPSRCKCGDRVRRQITWSHNWFFPSPIPLTVVLVGRSYTSLISSSELESAAIVCGGKIRQAITWPISPSLQFDASRKLSSGFKILNGNEHWLFLRGSSYLACLRAASSNCMRLTSNLSGTKGAWDVKNCTGSVNFFKVLGLTPAPLFPQKGYVRPNKKHISNSG